MPQREGQRVIDKFRQLAAVTGYWPLGIAVLLLVSLPYRKLEVAHNERMRIWSQLVQMSTEQETASYQPVMDMIWERDNEHAPYEFIAGAVPIIWLAAAVIFRKSLRRALHLEQPNDPQSVSRTPRD